MNDEMKYELLTEITGRMQAELLQSYLKANGVDAELFQEAVGHQIFPVTIEQLGSVQVFVPKEEIKKARELLKSFSE